MAPPEYSGVFFYDGENKIIVSKVVYSDLGFAPDTQDGTVVYKDEVAYVVKCPNGCVRLVKFDGQKHI